VSLISVSSGIGKHSSCRMVAWRS